MSTIFCELLQKCNYPNGTYDTFSLHDFVFYYNKNVDDPSNMITNKNALQSLIHTTISRLLCPVPNNTNKINNTKCIRRSTFTNRKKKNSYRSGSVYK